MKNDAFLDFQRTAAADQSAIATALSGDWIDQLAKRDIGAGGGLCIATNIGTTFTPTWSAEEVTVTIATDVLALTDHVLPVGTPVVFENISAACGLTAGTIYYVSYNDATSSALFAVSTTLANAKAGVVVDLITNDGATADMTTLNTLEVQLVMGWDEAGTVDPANSEGFQVIGSSGPITFRGARAVTFDATGGVAEDMVSLAGHGLSTGTPVVFAGADLALNLVAGTRYYAIWVNDNVFQVAISPENARAGVAFGFADDGSESTVTIDDGQLTAGGPMIITEINPLSEDIGERYLRVRYLVANGDFLTGKVRSLLVMTADLGQKKYPTGWAVA